MKTDKYNSNYEIFGGYTSYIYANQQVRLNKALFRVLTKPGAIMLSELLSKMGRSKLMIKVGARIGLDQGRVAGSYSGSIPRKDLCNFLLNTNRELYDSLLSKYALISQANTNDGFLNAMLRAEMSQGLQTILQQTDRMTMAASVETRVPFLDHELVEFVFSLPSNLKVRGFTGKYLLKKYLSKFFPRNFIYRKKMGFPTPLFDWVMDRKSKIHDLVDQGNQSQIARHFNIPFIRSFIQDAQNGKMGMNQDLFSPLIRFISFKIWWDTVSSPGNVID